MPLTPEDVSNKRFTTVRLREGYDMTEVDQFLDEVEAELARLTSENAELRVKLDIAQSSGPGSASAAVVSPPVEPAAVATAPDNRAPGETATDETAPDETTAAPGAEQATDQRGVEAAEPAPAESPADLQPVRVPPVESLQVTTTAEASVAAARLLELAGRNVDQLVGDAQEESERILTQARTSAEELEAEARRRAEALDEQTTERRRTVFGQIEEEKGRLDSEIENLRAFEREYRAELRTYFEEQLAALDGQGTGGVLGRSEQHPEG